MQHPKWAFLSCLVSVVVALTSIGLLLLSGWFIAASALAGLLSLATFNYLVPAAVIRMLAIFRIVSGYAEKTLGHAVLLHRLQALRQRVFTIFLGSTATEVRAEQLQRLVQDVDIVGNRWLSVSTPLISLITTLILITGCLWLFSPELLPVWGLLLLLSGLLSYCYYRVSKTNDLARRLLSPRWRARLENTLYLSHLWPMVKNQPFDAASVLASQHDRLIVRKRQKDGLCEAIQVLLMAVFVVMLFVIAEPEIAALIMIPVMALLSYTDWFGAAVRSVADHAEVEVAKQQLTGEQKVQLSPECRPEVINRQLAYFDGALQLNDFRWVHPTVKGPCVNHTFESGQLVWLKGSSGSGKSSLLKALAGLLPAMGEVKFGEADIAALTINARLRVFHYIEQFPYVLSATLRDNLTIAKPSACDAELKAVLKKVALGDFEQHLSQWVGECGRCLSGGERKRLGVARGMLSEAPVWLVDEPFEGVNPTTASALLSQMNNKKDRRIIIIASHIWPVGCAPDYVVDLDQPLSQT